jgi:hypothetical protein
MRQLAMDRSGETAAEERSEQLFNESCDAHDRVARMRARTLGGMLAKLALLEPAFDPEDMLTGDLGTSEQILVSVAIDFKTQHAGWIA